MPNLWRQFEALLPDTPLMIGTVVSVHMDATLTVALLDGGLLRVKGSATPGDRVFVREGQVEGPAPVLEQVRIEI